MQKQKVIAFTTDPYGNVYGYSIVFFKLFDYVQKNFSDKVDVTLFSNDGAASQLVHNRHFKKISLSKNENKLTKTLKLIKYFLGAGFKYEADTIIVVNAELPELIAGFLLKIKYKKVYCLIQDAQTRGSNLKARTLDKIRFFLVRRIKNVLFSNKVTMGEFKGSVNATYIGNPVFKR